MKFGIKFHFKCGIKFGIEIWSKFDTKFGIKLSLKFSIEFGTKFGIQFSMNYGFKLIRHKTCQTSSSVFSLSLYATLYSSFFYKVCFKVHQI